MPSMHNQPTQFRQAAPFPKKATKKVNGRRLVVRGWQEEQKNKRRSFLSLEEAGLVEISGLGTHERFLCHLTVPGGPAHKHLEPGDVLVCANGEEPGRLSLTSKS